MKTKKLRTIKVGIDAHLNLFVVVMQEEGSNPKRARRFRSQKDLLQWLGEQRKRCEALYTCYEAGPFGYGLHRKLVAMGIEDVVICPQNRDERGKQVKTDRIDALALCLRLSRYVQGNRKAFSVVRVPTEQEELDRQATRHRERLKKERQRLARQGRGIMHFHSLPAQGQWWKAIRWNQLCGMLPEVLKAILEGLKELIERFEAMEARWLGLIQEQAREAFSPQPRPKGGGNLTLIMIEREGGDWNRFNNRRQIGSFTGLCPSESSSGGRRRQGSVSKAGDPLLRYYLVEMAWRVVRYQPDYKPVRKWREALLNGHAAAKKKAIVAIARQLAVDLWRWRTGQTTLENLNLQAA
jgi:transposase